MVNLDSFKDKDNLVKVLKHVVDNSIGVGVNLQVLTRFYLKNLLHLDPQSSKWSKEYRKAYMRLYRFFKALSRENYVELRKIDGLIWIKATDKVVDLIFYARKTQTRKITRKRLNPYKYTAKKFIQYRNFLSRDDWNYLFDLFNAYIEETRNKVLVFLSPNREIYIKRYSHRFQRRYLRKVSEKFDRIFANASKKYRIGVFITLTIDPKRFKSIMESSRSISKSWNRFMSYLRKKFGFRPPYISVLEFQDSGNPHLHAVIFGIEKIMARDRFEARLPKPIIINNRKTSTIWASSLEELKARLDKLGFKLNEVKVIDHGESLLELLQKWGFGKIHFEYQIVNQKGKWVWRNPKKKPTKLHNLGVGDYLKKYIKKIFDNYDYGSSLYTFSSKEIDISSMKISLYFATDKRFFTYSKSLYEPIYYQVEYGWEYVGSYSIVDPPDWLIPILDQYSFYDLFKGPP